MSPRSTTLTPSSGSMTSLSPSSTASKRVGASAETMCLLYARAVEFRWLRAVPVGPAALAGVPVVALVFEALGELRAALLGDAAIHEDVHEVWVDVAEDARVV